MADNPSPEPDLPRPLPPPASADRLREFVDDWRNRVSWAPIVALVVVAFAATWWITRPEPVAPVPPEEFLPVATPPPTPTPVTQTLVVHIAGAVESPGVISVLEGARVIDAIDLAGGLTVAADLTEVNLAGVVGDGQRIWIPFAGEQEPAVTVGQPIAPPPASGGESAADRGPININVAVGAELETLPGIGPATATAIIDHRERNGPFVDVDDLLDVAGIGPAKLDAIRASVVV